MNKIFWNGVEEVGVYATFESNFSIDRKKVKINL